jgi:hypothetical protein
MRKPPAHAITITSSYGLVADTENGSVDPETVMHYQAYCICDWASHPHTYRTVALMMGEEHVKTHHPSSGWVALEEDHGEVAQEVPAS